MNPSIDEILAFWFATLSPRQWFIRDDNVDAEIHARFGAVHDTLASADPAAPGAWEHTAPGTLATVLVLDQFSRNLFRGDRRAFACDAAAVAVAQRALARGDQRHLPPERAMFLYLPFEHSEDSAMQARSVRLFATLDAATFAYAERHKAIVDRFGRFPHRNAVLGRASTPAELAFLETPGSSF